MGKGRRVVGYIEISKGSGVGVVFIGNGGTFTCKCRHR